MNKKVIGHIDCPCCGHEMPIKEDKNLHAYGHCAHRCNAQVFTRNDHRDSLLRARMRPVTVTEPIPERLPPADPVPAPTPKPAPAPAPKPAPAPAPTQQPAPPKPKATFFTPLMGRTAR